MERTNRNIRRAALVLAILAILITVIIRIYVDSNESEPTNTYNVTFTIPTFVVETPVLEPVNGTVTYNCPSENDCSRTGSSEWFSLNRESNVVVVNTFGGTHISAVHDMHGETLSFTIVVNTDGTTTLTFDTPVRGRLLLTLNRGNAQSDITYGVR